MPDARTERWVQHRAMVRERLVDSAMRAIHTVGPLVSMREIAQEAKVPKPTLYRFFTDKAELAAAIGERLRQNMHDTIAELPSDGQLTGAQFIRSVISLYLETVTKSPNNFRFVMLTMADPSGDAAAKEAERIGSITAEIADLLRRVMVGLGGTDTGIDLDTQMLVGAVMATTHWWMNDGHDTLSMAELTDGINRQVRALLQATAHNNRVHIDFDVPIAAILPSLITDDEQTETVRPR